MACIEEDVALALVQGESVPPSARAHLAECETCRSFVAGLARVMVPDVTPSVGGWGVVDGQLAPGTALGEYRVEAVLGRGGMGVVYRGRDTRLDRDVAIKVLREDIGARRVAWLRREAGAMAKLSHPNVAAVFDFGESEAGPFVVMERVPGVTLGAWASETRTPDEIIDAYLQAAEGLAAAHRAGIVHRDFKPSNAMIVSEGDVGRVKVLDFGLAGAVAGDASFDDARGSSTLGGLGGTPRYAAPEQFLGEVVTPRSDQFSFCVALFEALAGELPFPGDTGSERRTAMLAGQMRPLPGHVPGSVANAVTRGLSVAPRRRFSSMTAMLAAMRRRPSRSGWVAAGLAVIGLGVWAGWPAAQTPCADGSERMQQAWPRPRAEDWTSRPELRRQAERLDEYVGEWLEVRAGLCAQRHRAPGTFDRGAACLERLAARVQSAGSRLLAFGAGDDALPSNLLADLDPPQRCIEESLDERVDEILRDEYEELYAWAVQSDVDGVVLDDERVRIEARAESLQRRARALGDTRVQGLLSHLLGTLAIYARDYSRAERRLEEGFFVAELAGDANTQLVLCESLVLLFSEFLAEGERASYWARKSAAVAERIATDEAAGRAALLEATASLAEGAPEKALPHFERAEPLVRGTVHHRDLLNRRAAAYARMQQFDQARADLNASIDIIESEFGTNYAGLVTPLNTLATLEIIDENFDEALAMLERVVSLIPAEDRLRRALVQGNLAILFDRTGQPERALETFESIAEDFEAMFGLEHEQTVRTKLAIVEVLIDLERTEEARREVERLLKRGLPDSFLARALLAHASVVEDPRPDLERVLTLPGEPESTRKIARDGLAALNSAR